MPPAGAAPLGDFEVLVLLAVLRLAGRDEAAYGSTIRDELAGRARRPFARGAVYITLDRLEDKGLLSSRLGAPTGARDGRPRRLFKTTPLGLRAAREAVAVINRMQEGLAPVLGRR
jgi:PadR family transcriptional regulator, regulatory protein PadR